MTDVLLVVGHQPWAKGAHNPRHKVSEFDFNSKLGEAIVAALAARGVDAALEHYQRGGGNVGRWSGASRLLVELHLNGAANTMVNGTCVLYGSNRPDARPAAVALAAALAAGLGYQLRHDPEGAIAVGPATASGRDARGFGGGYLVRATDQPSLVAEPFFISCDAAIDRFDDPAEFEKLVEAYAVGIVDALAMIKDHVAPASYDTVAENAPEPGSEIPEGYEKKPDGNVVRLDPANSPETKATKSVAWQTPTALAASSATGILGAFNQMKWEIAVPLILVIGVLGFLILRNLGVIRLTQATETKAGVR